MASQGRHRQVLSSRNRSEQQNTLTVASTASPHALSRMPARPGWESETPADGAGISSSTGSS